MKGFQGVPSLVACSKLDHFNSPVISLPFHLTNSSNWPYGSEKCWEKSQEKKYSGANKFVSAVTEKKSADSEMILHQNEHLLWNRWRVMGSGVVDDILSQNPGISILQSIFKLKVVVYS